MVLGGLVGPNAGEVETRWLPPGSIFEYWQMFNVMFPQQNCSFRYFFATWSGHWAHRLRFRGAQQHAMCATCVSHKLAIRALGGDLVRRRRQMELLDEHRKAQ